MHRRARHLNPAHAGAVAVWDSRFITGLSDGNSISTWASRVNSTYDATQSTSTNQPTYKTGIQGGQPVVRFDGSNDFLVSANPNITTWYVLATVNIQSSSVQGTIVNKGTSTSGRFDRQLLLLRQSNSTDILAQVSNNTTFPSATLSNPPSGWCVLSSYKENPTIAIARNGGAYTTAACSITSTSNTNITIGMTRQGSEAFPFNSDMAQIVLAFSVFADSLRKRLEHAAAFSFKLQTS